VPALHVPRQIPPLLEPPLVLLLDWPLELELHPLVLLDWPLELELHPLVLLDWPLDPLVLLLDPSWVPLLEPPLELPSDVSPQLSPVDALMQGPHCENSPPAGRHLRMPSRHADWPQSMRVPAGPQVQPIFGVSQLVPVPLRAGGSVPFAFLPLVPFALLPLEPQPGAASVNMVTVPNRRDTRPAVIRIELPPLPQGVSAIYQRKVTSYSLRRVRASVGRPPSREHGTTFLPADAKQGRYRLGRAQGP
jgi:hypothetical protein